MLKLKTTRQREGRPGADHLEAGSKVGPVGEEQGKDLTW